MAVIIKTGLDATGANQGTTALQGKLKSDIGGALEQVKSKAAEAEKSLKGMLDLGKVQQAAAGLGALKGALDLVGVSLLGLSKETEKAISSTISLAQQGVAAGASFGPWGALIGGAAGAAVGALSAASDAAEAHRVALVKVGVEAKAFDDKYRAMANKTLPDAVARLGALDTQMDKLADSIKGSNTELGAQLRALDALGLIKQAAVVETYAKNFEAATKAVSAASAPLKKAAVSVEDLGTEFNSADAAHKKAKESLEAYVERLKVHQALVGASLSTSKEAKEDAAELVELVKAERDSATDLTGAYGRLTAAQEKHVGTQKIVIDQGKILEDQSRARVAAIDEELRAMQERLAVAAEAAAARAEEGGGLDVAGMRETREEATALSTETLALFDTLALLPTIELPTPQLTAMEQAIAGIKDEALQLGDALQHALVDVGANAAAVFFDNIEAGKKPLEDIGKAFEKLAADQLKSIGKALVGEGLQNELKAAGLLILSAGLNPQGYALAGLGAAEIAAGLAMGAGGALLGRRGGHGASGGSSPQTSESLGARESEASGPRQLAPVKIYLGPEQGMAVFSGDQRGIAEYGRFTANAVSVGSKAPR